MGEQIIVEIAPDGAITIRAEGFSGPGCVEAVRRIAEALDGEIQDEQHTPAYYLASTGGVEQAVGQ